MFGGSGRNMSEEEKMIEELADFYTEKWIEALEREGKNVTPEGIKRYRESAKLNAMIKVSTMKRKGLL